jgi:P27 family predicted phage terminase small subunit
MLGEPKMRPELPSNLHIIRSEEEDLDTDAGFEIKKRIPHAEWLNDPLAWSEDKFINETSELLFQLYGNSCFIDRHLLGLLASEIGIYIKCLQRIKQDELVATFNNGKTTGANPFISIKNDAITKIIALMNQLGLSPKDRMKNGVSEPSVESKKLAYLMRGPQPSSK